MRNDAKSEKELTSQFKTDMRNLINFDPSTWKPFHFDGLLLIKVYNVWAEKVQFSYVWWHSRLKQSLKKNLLGLPKLTWGIWRFFTRALSLKIGTLMTSFCLKLEMCMLKIYRGVMCHDNGKWCKTWRGIDFSVQNWQKEFDKLWPEHSKISNICTLMGCF